VGNRRPHTEDEERHYIKHYPLLSPYPDFFTYNAFPGMTTNLFLFFSTNGAKHWSKRGRFLLTITTSAHVFVCCTTLFVPRNASYRDAGFRTRQSAFMRHISFPVMQFVRVDATACADVTEALPQIRYRLPVLFRNPGSVTRKRHAGVSHEFSL
jgi:hypothetical protein